MLFGNPLRTAISRSGRASPDVRNAESTRVECTTDLTRYGSREATFAVISAPQRSAKGTKGTMILIADRATPSATSVALREPTV